MSEPTGEWTCEFYEREWDILKRGPGEWAKSTVGTVVLELLWHLGHQARPGEVGYRVYRCPKCETAIKVHDELGPQASEPEGGRSARTDGVLTERPSAHMAGQSVSEPAAQSPAEKSPAPRWMRNNRKSSKGELLDDHWEDDNCGRLGCYSISVPATVQPLLSLVDNLTRGYEIYHVDVFPADGMKQIRRLILAQEKAHQEEVEQLTHARDFHFDAANRLQEQTEQLQRERNAARQALRELIEGLRSRYGNLHVIMALCDKAEKEVGL